MEEFESDVQRGALRPLRVRVRHSSAPHPNGCRWCGRDEYGHGLSYTASTGFHSWGLPTPAQRKARMLARSRAARHD